MPVRGENPGLTYAGLQPQEPCPSEATLNMAPAWLAWAPTLTPGPSGSWPWQWYAQKCQGWHLYVQSCLTMCETGRH